MTFSERLELERDYHKWLEDESKKVGAVIDGSRLSTALIFLKTRGMLVEDTNQKRFELRNYLMNCGAVTVDPMAVPLNDISHRKSYWCMGGATVSVDYITLSNAFYKWLREG